MEQRFKGLLILLIAHSSDDRVPSCHEVLEVLVDELDREQVLKVVNCTMFDVRAEVLVNHQKNLAPPRIEGDRAPDRPVLPRSLRDRSDSGP